MLAAEARALDEQRLPTRLLDHLHEAVRVQVRVGEEIERRGDRGRRDARACRRSITSDAVSVLVHDATRSSRRSECSRRLAAVAKRRVVAPVGVTGGAHEGRPVAVVAHRDQAPAVVVDGRVHTARTSGLAVVARASTDPGSRLSCSTSSASWFTTVSACDRRM